MNIKPNYISMWINVYFFNEFRVRNLDEEFFITDIFTI